LENKPLKTEDQRRDAERQQVDDAVQDLTSKVKASFYCTRLEPIILPHLLSQTPSNYILAAFHSAKEI
jgi:predicted short-subunit dehydrogenase-like oxidoreductase (DUF2520 family)